jgi:hypothetical protein
MEWRAAGDLQIAASRLLKYSARPKGGMKEI